MADVSIQLHACLNAMKNLSREKKDIVAKSKKEIADLRKEYEALGNTIKGKESTLQTSTQELDVLDRHITETQQSYKKILDSTSELMKQVSEYNPANSSNTAEHISQKPEARKNPDVPEHAVTNSANNAIDEHESKPAVQVEDTNKSFSSRFKHMKRNPKKNTKSQEMNTPEPQSEENISLSVSE